MSSCSIDSPITNRGIHRGLPTYFRASCRTASRGEEGGYFSVGRKLAGSLANEAPFDLEDDEWYCEVQQLEQLICEDSEDDAIWQWFEHHFPRCMALVPVRRKERFVAGVRDAAQDDYGFGF